MQNNSKYRYRLAAGLCTRCGIRPLPRSGAILCDDCRPRERARNLASRRSLLARRRAEGRCTSCGGKRDLPARMNCEGCRARSRSYTARWRQGPKGRVYLSRNEIALEREARFRQKRRQEVLDAYGGRCACCGEATSAFLTIDHVNNDGAAERGLRTHELYAKLKRHGFPRDRYQLLCFNCNLGKHYNGGTCPHKEDA